MGLQLVPFSAGDLSMKAFDVVAQKIEQVGLGVELGLGVAAGDTAEERPVGGHGLADGRGGLALVTGRAVIDDIMLRTVGDADAEVRKDAAEFLAQGHVDGLAGRRSAAAYAAAAVVDAQRPEVVRVPSAGNPSGKPVDHGQRLQAWIG